MFKNPEARRGLRSIVMAIAVLVLLYFLWEWSWRMADLSGVARGSLILLGIAMLGYQFENAMRAFKLSAGKDGVTVEASGDND